MQKKTIFITGATSGFGRALSVSCSAAGAKVIAAGRREERLRELVAQYPDIHTISLDVRNKQAVEQAVAELPSELAAIDILVNNAGLALGCSSFENQLPEDNQQMIETNINGMIFVTGAILPGMISRNCGHIVNIGSVAGTYPYPGGNVYGASKAFVAQFSLNLRADLLGRNIRVTNIEPGMCDTEFSKVRFHGDENRAKSVYEGIQPLTAEDIADSIIWCINRPPHMNVNRLEIMPVMQAFSPFAVARKSNL